MQNKYILSFTNVSFIAAFKKTLLFWFCFILSI